MVEEFYRSPDDTSVVTKASLFRKLRDPAFCVKELRAPFSRQRYFVAEDVLAELNMKDLPLPEPTGLKDKPVSAEKAAASDTSEAMAVASPTTEAKAGKVKGQKRERPGSLKLAMKTAAAKPKKRRVPIVLTEEDKSWCVTPANTTTDLFIGYSSWFSPSCCSLLWPPSGTNIWMTPLVCPTSTIPSPRHPFGRCQGATCCTLRSRHGRQRMLSPLRQQQQQQQRPPLRQKRRQLQMWQ